MAPSRKKPAKSAKAAETPKASGKSQDDYLNDLRSAITKKAPYCTGIVPVSKEDLVLYYGVEENAQFVTLLPSRYCMFVSDLPSLQPH